MRSPRNYGVAMASAMSRESYFDTGLDVLSDLGYGGLKLAEVCNRLGVTTGSFYHYFTSWSAYTRDLVAHWVQARTVGIIEASAAEPDPRRRIDALVQEAPRAAPRRRGGDPGLELDRPEVHAVQAEVDQQRFDVLRRCRRSRSCATSTRRRCSRRGRCISWSATSRPRCRATPATSSGSPRSCSTRWTRAGSARVAENRLPQSPLTPPGLPSGAC